jgi:serine/threonine protein kinase
MGIVHKAKDLRLGRLVALKFLFPDAMENPTLLRLFHREARAAAQLTHPGIVTIYDVGAIDGREFIAMEFVEGETLDTELQLRGPMPIEKLLDIAEKVFSAIEYAHSKNVIHRDIKPANVMLTKQGVKVMDFGLAKVVNSSTGPGMTVIGGTPNYMPPEQLTGQTDHRSDIFALGATFYELATGVLPGRPGIPAHRAEGFPSPKQIVPTVPARLSELLMQCIEHHPADRPQDLPTMLREIRAVRAELVTVTPAVKVPQKPATAVKQRPARISREDDDDEPRKNIVDVVDFSRKK